MKKRHPTFEVYESADGWRWRLRAANSQIVASGEAYASRSKAWRAVRTVAALAGAALTAGRKPMDPT